MCSGGTKAKILTLTTRFSVESALALQHFTAEFCTADGRRDFVKQGRCARISCRQLYASCTFHSTIRTVKRKLESDFRSAMPPKRLTDESPFGLHHRHHIVGVDVMPHHDERAAFCLEGEKLVEVSVCPVDEVSRGQVHRKCWRRRNRTERHHGNILGLQKRSKDSASDAVNSYDNNR